MHIGNISNYRRGRFVVNFAIQLLELHTIGKVLYHSPAIQAIRARWTCCARLRFQSSLSITTSIKNQEVRKNFGLIYSKQ